MPREQDISVVARALAHPARVRIVLLLAKQRECMGAEVFNELPLAQSTISEHLRVLKDAGIVLSHATGTSMVYCLVPAVLESFASQVAAVAETASVCWSRGEGC